MISLHFNDFTSRRLMLDDSSFLATMDNYSLLMGVWLLWDLVHFEAFD